MAKVRDDRNKQKQMGGETALEEQRNESAAAEHTGSEAVGAYDYEKTLREHARASTLDHPPGSVTRDHLEENIRSLLEGLLQGDEKAELNEPMEIHGSLTVDESLTVKGSVQMNDTLTVEKAVQINNDLNVTGSLDVSSESYFNSSLFVGGSSVPHVELKTDGTGVFDTNNGTGGVRILAETPQLDLVDDTDGFQVGWRLQEAGTDFELQYSSDDSSWSNVVHIDGEISVYKDINMDGNSIDFEDDSNDRGSKIDSLGNINLSGMSSNNGTAPINCTQSLDVEESDSYAIRNYGGFYSSGYLAINGSVINTKRIDFEDNNRPRDSWEIGADGSVRWTHIIINYGGSKKYLEASNTSW